MPSVSESILIVDDDPDIQEVLSDRLESLGYRIFVASNFKESLELLKEQNPRLILLDVELPDKNGLEGLKEIRQREKNIPVVMITAYSSIERAVQAMKAGAFDFIPKPFEPNHVALIVRKALEREGLKRELAILTEEVGERYRLVVGKSAEMNKATEIAKKAASSKSTILLLGESGTGKEIFARAIHNWSERNDKPFIAINCAGLSRELLESELFGHEKGAFTGAHQQKEGKLELANGGTVFFDEIGDISSELQTKLLRFLQEREFERVGGTKSIPVDVRIIAATNRALERAVGEGRFREDLYHRLNVIAIALPPLRERREDITPLAHFFLRRFCKETKRSFTDISPEALARLTAYDWPGNVRELANVIEQAVVLAQGPTVTLQDLPSRIVAGEAKGESKSPSYREALDSAKRDLIVRVLSQTKGNRAAAAKLLGLQRTYLSRLIKTLQID